MLAMTVTQAQIDAWAINMKVYFNDVEAVTGSLLNTGDVIKIVAKEGFKFDSVTNTPMVYLNRKSGSLSSSKFAQFGENDTEAYHTVRDADSNFSGIYRDINAGTLLPYSSPTPNFVYTVIQSDIDYFASKNCSLYKGNTKATLGTTFRKGDEIKLVADSGYYFGVGTSFTYVDGYEQNFSLGGASNPTTASYDLFLESPIQSFDVVIFSLKTKVFSVTNDVLTNLANSNAVMLRNGVTVNSVTDLYKDDVITINANNGYTIDSAYFMDEYNSVYEFSISGNTAIYTLQSSEMMEYLVVYTEESSNPDPDPDPDPEPEPPKFVRFKYTSEIKDSLEQNHTKMFNNGVVMSLGENAYNGDLLEIRCDSGYELISRPQATAYDSGSWDYVYFDLAYDSRSASLYLALDYNFSIGDIEVLTTQTDEIVGGGLIYKITEQQLQQINKDRFYASAAPNIQLIDYGVNILGVIKLPFNISPNHIQDDEVIKLGSHTTTVSAPKIDVDKLVVNLGDIEVQAPSNLLDYSNTRVLLHLPYAPIMTLDIDYVLGYVINIEYIINLYNGNAVINIKSSKTDKIIASGTVDLGVNIPYSSDSGNNPTSNNTNVMIGGDNHVKSPFIEINRNIPLLADKFFTIPVIDESELIGNIGFVRVDEIDLNVSATSREKELIISALKAGVIIK